MNDKNSIILLSGGLDSVISLAAAKEGYNITLALTFDYGQKAKEYEINAAKKIADFFQIEHKVISVPWLANITQTSLVNSDKTPPKLNANELDTFEVCSESAKNVWVPNRNGLFINIAAAYSDSYGFTHILFGANKEEGTTFPDNTQEFIDKITESLSFSTLTQPKVIAPLIKLTKKEIIALGVEKNAPFDLIRSCYMATEKHCGECESCLRLKRALIETGNLHICEQLFEQKTVNC